MARRRVMHRQPSWKYGHELEITDRGHIVGGSGRRQEVVLTQDGPYWHMGDEIYWRVSEGERQRILELCRKAGLGATAPSTRNAGGGGKQRRKRGRPSGSKSSNASPPKRENPARGKPNGKAGSTKSLPGKSKPGLARGQLGLVLRPVEVSLGSSRREVFADAGGRVYAKMHSKYFRVEDQEICAAVRQELKRRKI